MPQPILHTDRISLVPLADEHLEFAEPLPGAEDGEVEYAITRSEWRVAEPGDRR